MQSVDKILKRANSAKRNKSLWEPHIRECYEYALPERNTIDQWAKGAKKRNKVFDDTAPDALEDFANRMTAMLVPSNTHWYMLEAGSDIPESEVTKVNKYLEDTTKIIFEHINSSNFTSQVSEAMLDLGISTGCLVCEEGDGIQSHLNFRAISLSELCLERSDKGIVDTVFRFFKTRAVDIKELWPTAVLTESLNKIQLESPDTEVDLIEGVVYDDGKYRSVLLYEKEKALLIDTELDYNPYIVFRESTIAGEVYGRGRVMRQLNNIKTLNRMFEDYLKGLSFQANPIFTATDDGVINPHSFKLAPGTVNAVGSNDRGNPTLNALQLSGNPQLMDHAVKGLQDTIRRALLSKPFGNVNETPVRTATEMSIRNADQMQTNLAATSKVQSEFNERVIANAVNILKRAGKIAEFKVDGKEVKIKFINPATRQKDEAQLAAYGRFAEFVAASGLPMDVVAQKIKIEDLPVAIWDTLGLPEKGKRDEQEQAAMAQQQQQMLAAQQAAMAPQGQPQ